MKTEKDLVTKFFSEQPKQIEVDANGKILTKALGRVNLHGNVQHSGKDWFVVKSGLETVVDATVMFSGFVLKAPSSKLEIVSFVRNSP